MTHDANRVIEQILQDKKARHRKASQWVHEESQLEATGEVLMGDLVSGDLRTIERCIQWIQDCPATLPAVPVPAQTPHCWTLHIDQQGMTSLEQNDARWLQAMDHLLFDGPEPARDCPVWESLSSIGLPPGLREDLEQS